MFTRIKVAWKGVVGETNKNICLMEFWRLHLPSRQNTVLPTPKLMINTPLRLLKFLLTQESESKKYLKGCL
jgi:hypothetical protein